MLMKQNVNNDVTKDSPLESTPSPLPKYKLPTEDHETFHWIQLFIMEDTILSIHLTLHNSNIREGNGNDSISCQEFKISGTKQWWENG